MGVDQLGLQVKLEAASNFNFFSSELNEEGLALLDELARKQRVENSIDILTNAVDHEALAGADSQLDLLLPMRGSELD